MVTGQLDGRLHKSSNSVGQVQGCLRNPLNAVNARLESSPRRPAVPSLAVHFEPSYCQPGLADAPLRSGWPKRAVVALG